MAIRHIREAFDQEADGVAVSLSAILEYVEGTKQRLTIKASIAATNEIRSLMSDVHGMESEPNEEGRKLARALKAQLAAGPLPVTVPPEPVPSDPAGPAPSAPLVVIPPAPPPLGAANPVPAAVAVAIPAAAPAGPASDPPPVGANPFM